MRARSLYVHAHVPWAGAGVSNLVIDWATEAGREIFCAVLAWSTHVACHALVLVRAKQRTSEWAFKSFKSFARSRLYSQASP